MPDAQLPAPETDPTLIFEHFRGSHATELLTAAVAHFNVFGQLHRQPMTLEELRAKLGLEQRPAVVLLTALKAMQLLWQDETHTLHLTELAREHLVLESPLSVCDYIGLAATSPNVLNMVERLRANTPAGADDDSGAAFIYRQGIRSAMEAEESARHFTLALAGRAKNVAPHFAAKAPMEDASMLLDVGGGTGIYAIACPRRQSKLRAAVVERPEVLKVAHEMAAEYGVADRLELIEGDMFVDPLPTGADVVLLSNILHDWDIPDCQQLVTRCATALSPGGQLLIHDVFLNDLHDGPLPIALYSASLFHFTQGRAYSAAEYRQWLTAAGLTPGDVIPTLVHCGILPGTKLS